MVLNTISVIRSKAPIMLDKITLNALCWRTPDGEEVYLPIKEAQEKGYEFLGYDLVEDPHTSNVYDYSIFVMPDARGIFSRIPPRQFKLPDLTP